MMMLMCVGTYSPRSEPSVNPPHRQQNGASQLIPGPEFKQRQIAFPNRIRDADPKQQVNDQSELSLIPDRSVEMNTTAELMRALLAQTLSQGCNSATRHLLGREV
jgi:hypothetical protein